MKNSLSITHYSFLFFVVFAFAFSVGSVRAEDLSTTSTSATTALTAEQREYLEKKNIRRENFAQTTTANTTISNNTENFETNKAARMELREQKREELQQKIATVRDERKQALISTINDKLENVNARSTSGWANVLNKLTSILDKLQEKETKLETEGKDTSAAQTSIDTARNAIAAAQNAVQAQSEKDYTLTFSSESTVGQDVSGIKETLRTDLKVVHESVKAAHMAVREAAKSVQSVL